MIFTIFKLLFLGLLFLSVVIPNSLQTLNAAMLVVCFVFSTLLCKPLKEIPQLIKMYAATAVVTTIYIAVGQINAAPREAAEQTVIIYFFSPLLWMFISCAMVKRFADQKTEKWLIFLTFSSIISVAFYFYLFSVGGPEAVSFFIENANVNLQDGYAGATMFVYGSLIFLTSGFFAASSIVKSTFIRAILLGGLAIAAITSGRSALILSLPIGLIIGTFFSPRRHAIENKPSRIKRLFSSPLFYFIVASTICLTGAAYLGVDVRLILGGFTEELGSGGGGERSSQIYALIEGVFETFGLGAGHGVGVSLIRSETFPWRYENVWAATVYRTGIFGAMIYALPFFFYIKSYFYLKSKGILNQLDLFLFAGFFASFVASITNPYIEAFAFQWMFIIPMVSLSFKLNEYRRSLKDNPKVATVI